MECLHRPRRGERELLKKPSTQEKCVENEGFRGVFIGEKVRKCRFWGQW